MTNRLRCTRVRFVSYLKAATLQSLTVFSPAGSCRHKAAQHGASQTASRPVGPRVPAVREATVSGWRAGLAVEQSATGRMGIAGNLPTSISRHFRCPALSRLFPNVLASNFAFVVVFLRVPISASQPATHQTLSAGNKAFRYTRCHAHC